jgi:hypothetical protein
LNIIQRARVVEVGGSGDCCYGRSLGWRAGDGRGVSREGRRGIAEGAKEEQTTAGPVEVRGMRKDRFEEGRFLFS